MNELEHQSSMEEEIYIPQPIVEVLLIEAAEREVPVEELLTEIIKKYMERNETAA